MSFFFFSKDLPLNPNIIQIYNSVQWEWQYSAEYS